MANCECLPRCPFFNDVMGGLDGMTALYKKRYCSGEKADWTACARYQIFKAKGRDAVPKDLFPNQADRVANILGQT